MENTLTLEWQTVPLKDFELHLPKVYDQRILYLMVDSNSELGGFALWEITLDLLDDIDSLDGKRIHLKHDGECYDDDTLGTDIIGSNDITDLNYWNTHYHEEYDNFAYGDILVDFKLIENEKYYVHIEMTLTDNLEDGPEYLELEDYGFRGGADFVVNIDEEDPYSDSR